MKQSKLRKVGPAYPKIKVIRGLTPGKLPWIQQQLHNVVHQLSYHDILDRLTSKLHYISLHDLTLVLENVLHNEILAVAANVLVS
jgi:hypothetical protein